VKGVLRSLLKPQREREKEHLHAHGFPGIEGEVPDGEFDIPFGQADVKRQGADVTAVAFSRMVHRTLEAAEIAAAIRKVMG